MANVASTALSSTPQNERKLGLAVVGGALLILLAVWGWSRLASAPSNDRPKPVWLGVNKVIAQMTDGRMLKLRVDLNLNSAAAVDELSAHQDAIRSLVEEAGGAMSHEELEGPDGMQTLASHIQTLLNDYLAAQHISHRVRGVVFEEWTLLPS